MSAHRAKPWSLRRRLTLRVLALVVGGWLATMLVSTLVLRGELNQMFDEELQVLVEATVLSLDAAGNRPLSRAVGVQANDGERVLRILSADEPAPPAPWTIPAAEGFHDSPGWRVLRRHAEGAVIEAAHATAWRREELIEAVVSMMALILPLIALLIWALRRTVTETMFPVGALAETVAARGSDDLSPIDGKDLPREMQSLVRALNAYIGRIEDLRQAERRFVANAAHELRTPIAAIRAQLQQQGDQAAPSVDVLDALTQRVERLLQMSRIESGLALGRGPCDLVRVLRLMVADLRARTEVKFDDSDLEHLLVPVDPDALAILLRNVLDNAVEHGRGPVSIRLTADGALSIANQTANPAFLDAPFEKGADSVGAGLGLSIISATAEATGIAVTSAIAGGVARVWLQIPLGEPATDPAAQ